MEELTEDQIKAGVQIGGPWQGPTAEDWIERVMSRDLNDGGAPTWKDWQTKRRAPAHGQPYIQRELRDE